MTVPLLFALLGSVILIGFFANLLFRLFKIPSVLVLIAVGVVLGPVTGWLRHDALLTIAPYFGAVALLVILFEGGLELDVAHVVRHAPRTAVFTVVVFALSMMCVATVGHFALGLAPSLALMLGAVLGATSPAICMPVVSGLSLRDDVKTVIKLESALGEVLLIVSVVLLIQSHETGVTGASGWVWGFARSLGVAVAVASVAGVLWSRLVSWLGREPLSYMLTLGVTCLLYFVVEEFGGSPAIAVLLFGLLLANMQYIAGQVGPHLRELFGIDVTEDQFVLGQFMVNITAELSFLVRTFFFVYLGLLLNLAALSWSRALWVVVIFVLLLVSRRAGMVVFRRVGAVFTTGEWQAVMALQPRGLATAVVAFMPLQAGIGDAAEFPLFAFLIVVLSNLVMTGGVLFAERRLRLESTMRGEGEPRPHDAPSDEAPSPDIPASLPGPVRTEVPVDVGRPPMFSPARDFEDEPRPTSLSDWLARVSGLRLDDREAAYGDLLRASYLGEPLFWVQAVLGAAICTLGLLMGQTTVVVGGALVVPVARSVLATGLALGVGDLYLLVRLVVKVALFSLATVLVSASLVGLVPLPEVLGDIALRTRPTILDFLVALFGGMSTAAIVARRRGPAMQYLPGAVVGLTLVPALCVMGFALTDAAGSLLVGQAVLQFSANLFAAILGGAAVLLALGVHRASRSDAVREWKAAELARPWARAALRSLGLSEAMGAIGSVRARLVVISLFLLALLSPLQLAFFQVRAEFRARQAVAGAIQAFHVPQRSAIVGSTMRVIGDQIDVRVQVATSALFSSEDRVTFERRVRDDTGLPTHLELVQTVADVGDADALRRLLDQERNGVPAAPAPTVLSSLHGVDAVLSQALGDGPLPGGAQVIGVRATVAAGGGPALDLVYLSPAELDGDARALLTKLVATATRVPGEDIALSWIGASLDGRLTAGHLSESLLVDLRAKRPAQLPRWSAVVATLTIATSAPPGVDDVVAREAQEALGLGTMPTVRRDRAMGRHAVRVTLVP